MAINDPVPSTAFDVLQRNAQDVDRYLNTSTVFNNRVGLPIKPIPMQAAEWQTAIGSVGWFPVGGDFSTGATLTARNQVIYDPASTAWYSWGGTLPKTVPATSSPASTGGISAGAWTMRSDAALATALNNGTALINGLPASGVVNKNTPNMVDGVKNLQPVPYYAQRTRSFYTGGDPLGLTYYYDPSKPKDQHNGGTVIAPEALAAWNGSAAQLPTFLNWAGSGLGAYVAKFSRSIYPEDFGALGDGVADDQPALSAHANATKGAKITWKPKSTYLLKRQLLIFAPDGCYIQGNGALYKNDGTYEVDPNLWKPLIEIQAGAGSDVTFKNVRQYGSNDVLKWITKTTNYGVHAISVKSITLGQRPRSVTISGLRSEYPAGSLARVRDCTRVRIAQNDVIGAGFHGVDVYECDQVFIDKNTITGVGAEGGPISTGVQGGIGVITGFCNDVSITYNQIQLMTDTCSKAEGGDRVWMIGNSGDSCGKDGFKVLPMQGQTKPPELVIIANNIMTDLYDWRTDGLNLYATHNAKRVIFSNNIGSSDPDKTLAGPKNGVNLLNLGSGLGFAGFVTVTNNIIGKTFTPGGTYSSSQAWSIQMTRTGGEGSTFIVSGNQCFGPISAGGATGKTVISGNILGATDDPSLLILGGQRAAISASGSDIAITGNTGSGFGKLVEVTQVSPAFISSEVVISGNTGRNILTRAVDFLTGSATEDTESPSVSITGNIFDVAIGAGEAIRIRPNKQKIRGTIVGNTISGDYGALFSFFGFVEGDPLLGHWAIGNNSESPTNTGYVKANPLPFCERVTGDYATNNNAAPATAGRKYINGDIVFNSAPLSGRTFGWIMTNASTQAWVAMGVIP